MFKIKTQILLTMFLIIDFKHVCARVAGVLAGVCARVLVRTCECAYLCVCVRVRVCMRASVRICVYACECAYAYVSVCMRADMCVRVCMCVLASKYAGGTSDFFCV